MDQSLLSVLQDVEKHMVQLKSDGYEPLIMHHSPFKCEIYFSQVAEFPATIINIKNNKATSGQTWILAKDENVRELARVDTPLKEVLGFFNDIAVRVFGHPMWDVSKRGSTPVPDHIMNQLFVLPEEN
jgi:hypothetical protein